MEKKRHSMKVKLLISFFSLILSLGLLEIGLRSIGHFYFHQQIFDVTYRQPRGPQVKDAIDNYVILCVGDSFTRGDEGPYEETYPAQLAELLNANNRQQKFSVINQGVCGYNSRQLLKYLPNWLKHYRPDAVVILVGATNRFNPWGYNLQAKQDIGAAFKDMISDLRVFKMIRLIMLNLKSKTLGWNSRYILTQDNDDTFRIDGGTRERTRSDRASDYYEIMELINSPSEDDQLAMVWFYCNTGQVERALKLCQESLIGNPDSENLSGTLGYIYLFKTRQYQQAAECYQQAFERNRQSEIALSNLAFFYREMGTIYTRKGSYALAIEYFLKSIQLDPNEHDNYYTLLKAYNLQSKFDSNFILSAFQTMIAENPDLEQNRLFINYFSLFKDKQGWEQKINKWMEKDLEKIVKLCQQNKVKLVVQNYPIAYPMANGVLAKIAQKNSLTFVENRAVFHRLISSAKRDIYLLDDDHCTEQGHRVMAENVYRELIK
ncbi:GDSL-type esterase/lipase family protein [Candidatus Omnitrophota bacterium]